MVGISRGKATMRRIVAVSSLTAALGCSLLVNRADTQCATTGDCAKFPGTVCVQGGCVHDTLDGALPDASLDEGGSSRPDTAPVTDCETTQECIAGRGSTFICSPSQKVCVDLTSRDCASVIGNSSSDKVVLLGALLPLLGPHKRRGLAMSNALSLAVNDFTARGGLTMPDGSQRPVAIVTCDESDDAVRAARQLSALNVSLVFGTAFSATTKNVARAVTIQDGTLLFSPSATMNLTSLNAQGLVQRTCPTDAPEAKALQEVVAILEHRLRAEIPLTTTDKIKVALVRKTDDNGNDLRTALLPQLVFNTLPAGNSANTSSFVDTNYGNPDGVPPDPNYAGAAQAVRTLAPHIVIVLGSTEAAKNIVKGIEDVWPSGPRRPYYVLSNGLLNEDLLALVADKNDLSQEDLRKRLVGTMPGADGARSQALGAFTIRYRQRFTDGSIPLVFGATQLYDAFYQAAYGIAASAKPAATGADIAAAIPKTGTPGARPFTVGAAQIDTTIAAIRAADAGGTINLEGLSGPLERDATGEVKSEVQIWCVARDAQNKPVFEYSGKYLNSARAVDGTVNPTLCPALDER